MDNRSGEDEFSAARPLSPVMCSQFDLEFPFGRPIESHHAADDGMPPPPARTIPTASLRAKGSACSVALHALYVTGNEAKFREASHVVRLCVGQRLQLERVSLELPELQGSPTDIAIAKTCEAARLLGPRLAAPGSESIRYIITDDRCVWTPLHLITAAAQCGVSYRVRGCQCAGVELSEWISRSIHQSDASELG